MCELFYLYHYFHIMWCVYSCVLSTICNKRIYQVSGVRCPRFLPRDATSVRPSACLSVKLRYRDHIGWNSSKLISRLDSTGCSLSVDPNIVDLIVILAGICVVYGKCGFRRTKALISLKRDKIGPRLYYWGPIASPISAFHWCQNQPHRMTFTLCTLFPNTFVFRCSPWKFEWRQIYTFSDEV